MVDLMLERKKAGSLSALVNRYVGKAEEIRILKTEMRTELAQQIMRRIGFYAASTL